MSSDSHRRQIESVNREIGQLHRKLADERKKEADKVGRIGQIERSITKSTSASSIQSKLREIERAKRDIEQCMKRQADLTRQIADKEKKKHGYEAALMKEQGREQQALQREQERRLREYRSSLASELSRGSEPLVYRASWEDEIPRCVHLSRKRGQGGLCSGTGGGPQKTRCDCMVRRICPYGRGQPPKVD